MYIYIYISMYLWRGSLLEKCHLIKQEGGCGVRITADGSGSIQSIYERLGMSMRRLTQGVRRVRRRGTHIIRGLGFRVEGRRGTQKVLGFRGFTSSHKKDSAGLLGVWERKVKLLLYRIQKQR